LENSENGKKFTFNEDPSGTPEMLETICRTAQYEAGGLSRKLST